MARDDEELMLAYAGGDDAAFRELFARYAPFLQRLVLRHVGRPEDARDLTQQAFLQLHRARRDFQAGTRFRPWMITIALNLARDLLRRRGRRPEQPMEDVELADPKGSTDPGGHEARRVRAAVAQLAPDQREVIELHWFADLSFDEISQVVGASPGAVRVRAHRGYLELRKLLDERNNPGASGVPGGKAR